MEALSAIDNEYPLKGGEDDHGNILKYRAIIFGVKITGSIDKVLKIGPKRIAIFEGYTIENYSQKEIKEMQEHRKAQKVSKKKEGTAFERIRKEIDQMVKAGEA
jgi:hypothetical protein